MKNKTSRKAAYSFILLISVVSLFSDFTYEGARSIIGPYLALLGASAVAVGFVSGLGEFIGYAFRIVTGWISDKTKNYWVMTIIGYGMNLVAIPLLAFVPANGWIYACGLILLERFGKAVRSPAKSTLVSFAAHEIGVGKGFAIHEALDQVGAFLGPMMLFFVLSIKGNVTRESYALGFLLLGITAIITLIFLFLAKYLYPTPDQFEKAKDTDTTLHFGPTFWWYMIAISLIAAGFADFPLMSYHIVKNNLLSDQMIPLIYAFAMAIDAVAALIFGFLYDKKGMVSLIIATAISSLFAPLVFYSHNITVIIIGVLIWGIGIGAQESILKASVSSMTHKNHRATAFGIFNTGFGLFWFVGSFIMGVLYDVSILSLIVFSMGLQLLSIPIFMKVISLNKAKNM